MTANKEFFKDGLIEPVSSIRYKLACACSENSNQPVHLQSLIRVLVFPPEETLGSLSDCAD